MKNNFKNILIVGLIVLFLFLIPKFQLLIIYFFIATVVAITINPLNKLIGKIKISKFQINKSLAALCSLLIIGFFLALIGYCISPLIIEEIQLIGSTDFSINLQKFLNFLIDEINKKLITLNVAFQANLLDLLTIMNPSSITGLFQSMLSVLGNIFLAIFSISFISFFLIRDRDQIKKRTQKLLSIIIPKADDKVNTIIYFIRRYFLGLCIQTTIMFILFGIGMWICGLKDPWTFALFAAVINIIPYFGPLIGFLFTITIVGTEYISTGQIDSIPFLITTCFILFGIVQTIDNILLQPTIYSRALKAHPLEIFFIVFAAGFIGGIMWMIIAMPIYTILRIIFSELMTKTK